MILQYFKKRKGEKELEAYRTAILKQLDEIVAEIPDNKENALLILQLIGKGVSISIAYSKERIDELFQRKLI